MNLILANFLIYVICAFLFFIGAVLLISIGEGFLWLVRIFKIYIKIRKSK